MSGESPAVILYDASGNQLATTAGTAPSSVLTIQGSASGTAVPVSGTVTANAGTGSFIVAQATAANLNAAVIGTTSAGSGASTGLLTVQGNASGTPIPITGSITATNPSVSTTAAAVPTSATFVGGEVQTLQSGLTAGDLYPLSLTTAGLLRVDGSNVTQPVSGTVAATQSGTWTVQPGNTANTTPWLATINQGGNSATVTVANALKVDGSAVTQPVSGTVTANAGTGTFNVVGTGTAGAPGTAALTVQGISSGTPVNVLSNHSTTGTITSVAGATSSTTLLAANTARVSATIYNDTSSGNILYIALAGTATTSSYTIKLWPGSYWDLPVNYTGIITGIWTSASGNARITELT
jgi:hypothetical protein